jgi:hypothetical protein
MRSAVYSEFAAELLVSVGATSEGIAIAVVVYLAEARRVTEEVPHVDGGTHNDKW